MDFKIFERDYNTGKQYYGQSHCDYDTGRNDQSLSNLYEAVSYGYPPAHEVLGLTLLDETPSKYTAAIEQFTLGAKKGELDCQQKLVSIFYEGAICEKNYEAALLWGTLYLQKRRNDKIQSIVNELTQLGVKYDEKEFISIYQEMEEFREYEAHVKALEEEAELKKKLKEITDKNNKRKRIRMFEQKYGPFIKYVYTLDQDIHIVKYDIKRSGRKSLNHIILYVYGKPIELFQLPCLSKELKEKISENPEKWGAVGRTAQVKDKNGEYKHNIYSIYLDIFGDWESGENIYFKITKEEIEIIFSGNNEESDKFEESISPQGIDWNLNECSNPDLW